MFVKWDLISANLNSFSGVLLSILLSCVAWMLVKALFRRKNRPPGPWGLPFVGYLPFLGEKPWETMRNLKHKYGDIVGLRLGQKYTIVLNEYNIAKEVLCHPASLFRGKDLFNTAAILGFGSKNGKEWKDQRKFCFVTAKDYGFGKEYWEDILMDQVNEFTEELRYLHGKPIDIFPLLSRAAVSTTLSLLLGRRLNERELELAMQFNDRLCEFVGPTKISSTIPGLRKLNELFKIAGYGEYKEIADTYSAFVRDEIEKHKTSLQMNDSHNFIRAYLRKIKESSEDKHTENSFPDQSLEGNINTFLLGAADTTASNLDWIIRFLTNRTSVQDKMQQELMDVLGKGGRARYQDKHKFPYTFAVIMEVQRCAPIAPFGGTRWINEDIPINGYVIPKGSEVIPNIWAIHQDLNYWKNPAEFRPERFLTNDGSKIAKQPPSFMPFSVGKRNCPGELIAYMKILFFVSEIVKKFEISTPDGSEPNFEACDGLVVHLKPQLLCFKERKN